MIRIVVGAATACLLGGLALSTPVAASDHTDQQRAYAADLRLDRPVTTQRSARLTGSAPGRDRVVLQKHAHGGWRDVRVVPVRDGAYRTKVGRKRHEQVFRARAGDVTSQARVVSARVPTDACGAQPRKADGSYWSCTFADDFSGSSLDRTKWLPQTIFSTGDALSGYACYDDDPSVVSVSGGTLNLAVRRNATALPCANGLPATPYRAGSVTTYHLFSQQYGRFEARIKNTATTTQGLQEAWWLWPDDRDAAGLLAWPLNGELDIAETYSNFPDIAVPFLHYTATDNGGPVPGLNTSWSCSAARGVYNTYTLEWTASRVEIFVNGKSCLVNTSGDPAFQKKYILNLTQALGTGSDTLTTGTRIPAAMNVDYVRVWK
jgi:beta-glucanase (GH16 family)